MEKFNTMVINRLRAYVYVLVDPRPQGSFREMIFYVGKGNGNRCFNHAKDLCERGEAPLDEKEHKLNTIRSILNAGDKVGVYIVAHGLLDNEALALEAALIPLVGETNKVLGHGGSDLWLSKNEIDQRYDRPIQRRDIDLFTGNVLFVSLNKQDIGELSRPDAEPDMAYASLGSWNISERHSRTVDCLIGVKNGLIVSIFRIDKAENGQAKFDRFHPTKPRAHGRSRFEGRRASDLEIDLVGRSLYDGDQLLTKIRPGAGCQFVQAICESN